MYVCGSNHFGQLNITNLSQHQSGKNSKKEENQVPYISVFTEVSGGDNHSKERNQKGHVNDSESSSAFSWSCCVLNEKSHVTAYGFICNKPEQRTTVRSNPVSCLAVSEKWIIGTDSKRHLWAWHRNKSQTFTGVNSVGNNMFIEVAASETNIIAVTDTGSIGKLIEQDNNELLFKPIPVAARIKHVSCGKEHVLASTRIGVVLTWGTGSRGQLGHGTLDSAEQPTVVAALEGLTVLNVAAGGWHSVTYTDQGDMYAWGWNESGQLGLPSVNLRTERGKETEAEKSQSPVIRSQDNTLTLEGKSEKDNCKVTKCEDLVNILASPALVDLPDCDADNTFIKAVSCGSRHSAACTETGELYTWGWNNYGQLGHGDVISRDLPKLVKNFKDINLYVTNVKCGGWNTAVWTTQSSIK